MNLRLEAELAVREAACDGTLLATPDQVAAYLDELRHAAQECFVVIALDAKNRVSRRTG